MLKTVRHLLLMLIAFAFVGGTTMQLVHAAQHGAAQVKVDIPCDMAMPVSASSTSASDDTKPMPPCKGLTPDCVEQMGCVSLTALPVPFPAYEPILHYSVIAYWVSFSKLDGLDRAPEPFPPRTI